MSERKENNIFSIDIFSYFIVNTVTIIVSVLLHQRRYTAFEYNNSVPYCLSWKIIWLQIYQ